MHATLPFFATSGVLVTLGGEHDPLWKQILDESLIYQHCIDNFRS